MQLDIVKYLIWVLKNFLLGRPGGTRRHNANLGPNNIS